MLQKSSTSTNFTVDTFVGNLSHCDLFAFLKKNIFHNSRSTFKKYIFSRSKSTTFTEKQLKHMTSSQNFSSGSKRKAKKSQWTPLIQAVNNAIFDLCGIRIIEDAAKETYASQASFGVSKRDLERKPLKALDTIKRTLHQYLKGQRKSLACSFQLF